MQLLQEHCLKYKERAGFGLLVSLIYAYKILGINVGVELLGNVWYNGVDK